MMTRIAINGLQWVLWLGKLFVGHEIVTEEERAHLYADIEDYFSEPFFDDDVRALYMQDPDNNSSDR